MRARSSKPGAAAAAPEKPTGLAARPPASVHVPCRGGSRSNGRKARSTLGRTWVGVESRVRVIFKVRVRRVQAAAFALAFGYRRPCVARRRSVVTVVIVPFALTLARTLAHSLTATLTAILAPARARTLAHTLTSILTATLAPACAPSFARNLAAEAVVVTRTWLHLWAGGWCGSGYNYSGRSETRKKTKKIK